MAEDEEGFDEVEALLDIIGWTSIVSCRPMEVVSTLRSIPARDRSRSRCVNVTPDGPTW